VATYESERVITDGFKNRDPWHDDDQDLSSSVELTDVPMEGIHGGTVCVLIDVPEEAALPYESFKNGKTYRTFRLPADVANQFQRRLDLTAK
jgi:hypothetical protein